MQGFCKKPKYSSVANKRVILPGTSIFGLLMYGFFSLVLIIQYRTICQVSLEVLPCWGLFCYENQTHVNSPYVLDTSSGPQAWNIPNHTFKSSCLSFSWLRVTTAFQKTTCICRIGSLGIINKVPNFTELLFSGSPNNVRCAYPYDAVVT